MRPDRPRRSLAGRAVWNVIDQGISSITNAAASIFAALSLSAVGFGYFAVAIMSTTLVLQVVRQVAGQPLVIIAAKGTPEEQTSHFSAAAGAALLMGVSFGAIGALCGFLLGGSAGQALLVAGIIMPGVVAQDVARFIAFARGRPKAAAGSDLLWLVLMFLGFLTVHDSNESWAYVLAWGAPTALCALLALVFARVRPRFRAGAPWVWSNRQVSGYLLLENVASVGSVQAAILVVGAVSGSTAVGAFRAAQTLLGPVNILGMAGVAFLVPEIVRRPTLSATQLLRSAAALSGILCVVNLVVGSALLVIPDRLGEQILGDTWSHAGDLLLPFIIWSCAVALTIGPYAVLQSVGHTRTAARCALVLLPLLTLGTAIGLFVGGAEGAMFGIAFAQALALGAWWPALGRAASARSLTPEPLPTFG